ncbi:MAG: hypothetical protein EOO40_07825, partial [Deltaproteobacteria bacterium]
MSLRLPAARLRVRIVLCTVLGVSPAAVAKPSATHVRHTAPHAPSHAPHAAPEPGIDADIDNDPGTDTDADVAAAQIAHHHGVDVEATLAKMSAQDKV